MVVKIGLPVSESSTRIWKCYAPTDYKHKLNTGLEPRTT